MSIAKGTLGVFAGSALERYGFPHGHPFGPGRVAALREGLARHGLESLVTFLPPNIASRSDLTLFHTPAYVDFVESASRAGEGFLDAGDTPVFAGIFEAAATVVGSTLAAAEALMERRVARAFVPVAGLHHARRDAASGFCVFNDCGVVIEALRRRFGIGRLAYVDIDAHHGDGIFYEFETDPAVVVADIHEDGRYLFPGTGFACETGREAAVGTKLNVPLPPGAGDDTFAAAWKTVEAHVEAFAPEFVIFQCGADGLAGDPLTHLAYTRRSHALSAAGLCRIADASAGGRILALGGGGYNDTNLGEAWSAVLEELLKTG